MRAVEISRFGGAERLRLVELPSPRPAAGQVRIAVRAAGVNFADVLCRLGVYSAAPRPPFVPGIEIAGEVIEVGAGVGSHRPGDRVAGFCRFGGYAEEVVAEAGHLLPIPGELSFADAAAFPVQYLTAWYALDLLARIEAGERLLVRSAAGGVGKAALELARVRGARTLATVGAEWKIPHAQQADPAARVILDREESLRGALAELRREGKGADVVLDGNGGNLFPVAWRGLAPGGRYVLYGAASAVGRGALSRIAAAWRLRKMAFVATLPMITANRTLAAFNLIHLTDRTDLLHRGGGELLALVREGSLRPSAARTFPLAGAGEAHREMQERRTVGKLVLEP